MNQEILKVPAPPTGETPITHEAKRKYELHMQSFCDEDKQGLDLSDPKIREWFQSTPPNGWQTAEQLERALAQSHSTITGIKNGAANYHQSYMKANKWCCENGFGDEAGNPVDLVLRELAQAKEQLKEARKDGDDLHAACIKYLQSLKT